MKARKPIRSEMGWSTVDKIVVRGHDLPNVLAEDLTFGPFSGPPAVQLRLAAEQPPEQAVSIRHRGVRDRR